MKSSDLRVSRDPLRWVTAFGAGVLATVVLLPQAKGELVYEEELQNQPSAQIAPDSRVEDRQAFRQVMGSSHKAQTTLQAEAQQRNAYPVQQPLTTAPAPYPVAAPVQAQPQMTAPIMPRYQAAPAPVAPAQPMVIAMTNVPSMNTYSAMQPVPTAPMSMATGPAAASESTPEVQNLSKMEMMRRERVREELKSEDILQERLEELRLRDERRRTEQLLGGKPLNSMAEAEALPPAAQNMTSVGLQQEMVVPPVTERPAQAQAQAALPLAPAEGQTLAAAYPMPMAATATTGQSNAFSTSMGVGGDTTEKTMLVIRPYGGVSNMNAASFDVRPHYSLGMGLGIGASDQLTFELAYTFNEYGVSVASTNPWIAYYQNLLYNQGRSGSFETLTMKQNVADAGLKLHLLGSDAKIRPFLGGGAAYSRSYVNYGQGYLNYLDQSGASGLARDYEVSSYLGYLAGGLDVRVTRSISIGASVKYYTVLSSRENQNLDLNGFTTYYPYASPYTVDMDKRSVGASLADSSFYSIAGGASFTF